jgi:hypothetical protein
MITKPNAHPTYTELQARVWKLETALGMIIQSGSGSVPDYIRQIAIEALRETPNE